MNLPAWICPYCGAENYSDIEQSIVRPRCLGCSQLFITAGDLEHKRGKELKELRGLLTDLRTAYSNLNDQRASAKEEVDRIDRKIYGVKADANRIECEIEVWENLKIYLSAPDQVERAERAKKDPCQRGLDLAGDEL
jgi:septal ring factor EnvC (AmiA/AmiB activator)